MRVDPEENLRMIADSVAFLRRRGQARDLRRRALLRRVAGRPRLRAALRARGLRGRGGERHAVRHQRRLAAARDRRGGRAPSPPTGIPVGIHCHNDAECGVANSLAAVAEGAVLVQGTLNGYGERCGNANLTSIVPNLQLKQGHECLPSPGGPDRGLAPARRAAEPGARRERALRGQERLRAQGRHAHRRRRRRPGDLRAHRPRRGRQRARGARLRALAARAR